MDLAIRFNDIGTTLYQSGEGELAYDMFNGARQALCLCGGLEKDALDPISWQFLLLDPSIQRAFDRASRCGASFPISDQQPQKGCDSASMQSRVQCIDTPFMYTEVFSMNELMRLPCGTVRYNLSMAIIMYNEALVLHRGLVPNSKGCLERACMFYNMAGCALIDSCSGDFIKRHLLASTLCAAILNNTGLILYEIGEFDTSKMYFARLSDFLLMLDPPMTEAESKRRQEFELNYMLFYRTLTTAAAA